MTPSSEGYINPVDCGAMIGTERFSELERMINDAESQGAEICCGGKRWSHPYLENGCYFEGTVIGGVEMDMEIAQREREFISPFHFIFLTKAGYFFFLFASFCPHRIGYEVFNDSECHRDCQLYPLRSGCQCIRPRPAPCS